MTLSTPTPRSRSCKANVYADICTQAGASTALVIYIQEMANNKYELTVHFQDAAQYEPASPLHNQALPPPAANAQAFNNGVGALGAHTPVPTMEH